jgi:guanylate kinase
VDELLAQGKKVVLRVDVNGALQIKEKIPNAILVFIKVKNMDELEKRIRSRATEDDATIKSRLELAKQEMPLQAKFDHVVVNPPWHPEVALQELLTIIQ